MKTYVVWALLTAPGGEAPVAVFVILARGRPEDARQHVEKFFSRGGFVVQVQDVWEPL